MSKPFRRFHLDGNTYQTQYGRETFFMKEWSRYTDYIMEQAVNLLAIDSPSGYGREVTEYLLQEFDRLGIPAKLTVKGGVLADFGGPEGTAAGAPGEGAEGGILLEAHCDTLGGMVAQIKPNGRLKLTPVGGMQAANGEAENVRIITKAGRVYQGTCQLINASVHVNGDYAKTERNWDTVEVVIDEKADTEKEVRDLGIMPGDYVCFEPRTRITESGYIKSRFLDDKFSAAILLGYAKYLKEEKITPARRVYAHFTIFEEVGHGGSSSVPEGVSEAWSVDMGCVGEGLQCTERQVSICAKDSGGPYNYDVVCRMVEICRQKNIDYAVDVYPHYGSDVEATLRAGHDLRHGLIGPGVYASHGYERSHRDGAKNTLRLIAEYIGR